MRCTVTTFRATVAPSRNHACVGAMLGACSTASAPVRKEVALEMVVVELALAPLVMMIAVVPTVVRAVMPVVVVVVVVIL